LPETAWADPRRFDRETSCLLLIDTDAPSGAREVQVVLRWADVVQRCPQLPKTVPTPPERPPAPAEPMRRGPRPKYDWVSAERAISKRKIEIQADIERHLANWFMDQTGDEPAESTIREHARQIYNKKIKGQ
jgi:hypothetical protein